ARVSSPMDLHTSLPARSVPCCRSSHRPPTTLLCTPAPNLQRVYGSILPRTAPLLGVKLSVVADPVLQPRRRTSLPARAGLGSARRAVCTAAACHTRDDAGCPRQQAPDAGTDSASPGRRSDVVLSRSFGFVDGGGAL